MQWWIQEHWLDVGQGRKDSTLTLTSTDCSELSFNFGSRAFCCRHTMATGPFYLSTFFESCETLKTFETAEMLINVLLMTGSELASHRSIGLLFPTLTNTLMHDFCALPPNWTVSLFRVFFFNLLFNLNSFWSCMTWYWCFQYHHIIIRLFRWFYVNLIWFFDYIDDFIIDLISIFAWIEVY